jgi:glycosyltransferase involved in cell wall biosynthesis
VLNNQPSELRVLQVLPALNTGGVERGTLEIAQALTHAGHAAFVASTGGSLTPTLKKMGGTPLLVSTLKSHLLLPYSIARLRNLIKKHNITLVHARSRAPAWAAYYAAQAAKIPYITTFHGAYNIQNTLKKVYNTIMTRGQKVIAPSQFIHDHLVNTYSIDPSKIVLIHRGVDLEEFNTKAFSSEQIQSQRTEWKASPSDRVLLFPGRLTSIKGHEQVIKALKNQKNKAFKLIIIGSWHKKEAYYHHLTNLIKNLDLQENVLIYPNTPSIAKCYAAADCVICPSTKPESFGRTCAEAGAMGKPVLTSDIGGSKEIILPGQTGFLIPPHNLWAMEIAIEKVLTLSKENLNFMGKTARMHIQKNFPLSKMQQKTIDLYYEILGLM